MCAVRIPAPNICSRSKWICDRWNAYRDCRRASGWDRFVCQPIPAPAVPEFCAVEAQLTLAETEMLNAKAWSAGTQAKRHIDFAITAIGCARYLLQSAEVRHD